MFQPSQKKKKMQYDCSLDQTVNNMNVITRAHMRMNMEIAIRWR